MTNEPKPPAPDKVPEWTQEELKLLNELGVYAFGKAQIIEVEIGDEDRGYN